MKTKTSIEPKQGLLLLLLLQLVRADGHQRAGTAEGGEVR